MAKFKTLNVYDVSVCLHNDVNWNCTLLSEPSALALVTAAQASEAPTCIIEAVTFARNVAIPSVDDGEIKDTHIVVADIMLGKISVAVRLGYIVPPKRGREAK